MALSRWTNPKRSCCKCSCEYALPSCRKISAGVVFVPGLQSRSTHCACVCVQPLLGTECAVALAEDVELRAVAPLSPVLSLRVPASVSHAAARRLRMHRVRAFGLWAAAGGVPSRLFYHPQVRTLCEV
jgi:hypothetical protein